VPTDVPLWFFILALGIVILISMATNAFLVWRFTGLCVVLGQHKSKVEENTFSLKALKKTLEQLFGKPVNGD
jgi:hypothetical protein